MGTVLTCLKLYLYSVKRDSQRATKISPHHQCKEALSQHDLNNEHCKHNCPARHAVSVVEIYSIFTSDGLLLVAPPYAYILIRCSCKGGINLYNPHTI